MTVTNGPDGPIDRDDVQLSARWCPRCGEEAALALEPPRFCGYCRRRMQVQVLPAGWTAKCVAHGATHLSG